MSAPTERITPDDIEASFRALEGDVDAVAEDARSYALTVGAAVVVGLVLVGFLLGRRRGKRHASVIEIRRV